MRDKFDAWAMLWVNRVSEVIILGFGGAALVSLLAERAQGSGVRHQGQKTAPASPTRLA